MPGCVRETRARKKKIDTERLSKTNTPIKGDKRRLTSARYQTRPARPYACQPSIRACQPTMRACDHGDSRLSAENTRVSADHTPRIRVGLQPRNQTQATPTPGPQCRGRAATGSMARCKFKCKTPALWYKVYWKGGGLGLIWQQRQTWNHCRCSSPGWFRLVAA